jgi:biopolymer transport protein TolR
MSNRRGRFLRNSHGASGQSQEFELNLAPVIDCLTVLITFVLLSASYLSVGVLEAQVAAASSIPQLNETLPEGMLSVEDHAIVVTLTGKINRVHRIEPNPDKSWNYNALSDNLALTRGELPALKTLVLNADSEVDYRQVVKTMDLARKAVPSVLLGGY